MIRRTYMVSCILLAASGIADASAVKKITHPTESNRPTEVVSSSAAARVSSWNLSGAIAARSRGKGWSASMNWTQQGSNQYQIRLSGPIGSGTLLVTKQGGRVTVRDGRNTVSSSNASALLKQQTGISLPVANLFYWVRGIPAPGAVQSIKRDSSGRIVVLRQAGYTIEFPQYMAVGKAILPSNIRLQGQGNSIKMAIRNWRI